MATFWAINFSSVILMLLARNSNSAVLEFLSSSALLSSANLIMLTGSARFTSSTSLGLGFGKGVLNQVWLGAARALFCED